MKSTFLMMILLIGFVLMIMGSSFQEVNARRVSLKAEEQADQTKNIVGGRKISPQKGLASSEQNESPENEHKKGTVADQKESVAAAANDDERDPNPSYRQRYFKCEMPYQCVNS
ncbi:OLC1v1020523C1 [Oldenlandia corymbosa var. corymbosa]|uniref:OLC1v1020523C1 n=1 Tax=Oldenlandia corymbosa var. corymbosa TaxID=529605 RepID=A0AAV1EGK5_OLDCO|nr:OLC1v1020523C1 [Oldenlandia corymbosa var. corymbosa]